MNYIRQNQLNSAFENMVKHTLQTRPKESEFKYKYICRNLDCKSTIKSTIPLSKDCQFCLHCIH